MAELALERRRSGAEITGLPPPCNPYKQQYRRHVPGRIERRTRRCRMSTTSSILIPARMAATRLPDKPLADIAGQPMIVHVLRRARRPASARWSSRPIRARSPRPWKTAGGRAVLTRPIMSPARTASSRRSACSIRTGARRHRRQCAGRPADAFARRHRGGARPAGRPGGRYRDARAEITMPAESDQSERREGGGVAGRAAAASARSISPAPPRRPARARSIITSGSMPIAARRSSASSRFRRRRSSSARGSSSCARWKPACGSTSRWSTDAASASIRRKIWRKRARLLARHVDSLTAAQRVTERHEQDRKSRFRASRAPIPTSPAREAYPDCEPVPCPTFEDALRGGPTGEADLGMIPIENSVAGRVADIHHLMPHSEPAHRRRIFPAGASPADGAEGRDAEDA